MIVVVCQFSNQHVVKMRQTRIAEYDRGLVVKN